MFGRIHDKYKRFDLGISSMEYIIQEIQECKMKIISNLDNTYILDNLINNLNLKNNIIFIGYTSSPEIFFKNISLHLFPSLSEAFPMVLSETKIYGIPNILLGLDYISMKEGGTIILYDDIPESLSKNAMKILKNDNFKKKLSKEARKDLRKYNNANLLIKWTKLILSIYYDDIYYQEVRNQVKKISENESLMILNNQIKLLRKRNKIFYNFTIKDFLNSINNTIIY
jgi:glycosyltransferase involved in cell wall biosynthesis